MTSINSSFDWVTSSREGSLSMRNSEDENFYGKYHILTKNQPFLVLLIFMSCVVGALLRTFLKEWNVPIIIILCFIGVLLGVLGYFVNEVKALTEYIAGIDPVLFLHIFTPVIIFTAAFEMDFYIVRKSLFQILLLSVPGFLLNCTLIGWLTYKINKYDWNWHVSMLFGIILSATDPILSVASVKNIGLSKIVINLIKGESLFNDATTVIVFELYKDLVFGHHTEYVKEVIIKLILKFFASTIFGFLSSRLIIYWLSHIFNDGLTEVILSFSMTYMIFFIAEWIGMSGVISLTVLGILLDSVSFSPGVDEFIFRFWAMLTFLAYVLIFIIIGIVIAVKTFPYVTVRDLFYILTVYLALNLIRGLVVLFLSPLLSRLGYGFNWRWGTVIVWSGMRGTFTLNMALEISHAKDPGTRAMKSMILLHAGTASLMTLMINSTTVKKLVTTLGLCNITLPKRMAMYNAVQRIKEMEANTFSMLKLDRFLADANWTMTEEAIKIDYPYKFDIEEVSQIVRTLKCPDCNKEISYETTPQQIADILEEARLRLLTAQIASYQKQYHAGMLNQEAAQTLIGAAESYVDIKGKFMNIHEVKTYWESKGLLVSFKKLLSDWVYSVKDEKFKSSRNKILKLCHQIVFMEEFEYISHIVTLLNFVPILMDFMPYLSELYRNQLKISNYYFIGLYILEASLKVVAMGRTYIFHHWNCFDLVIIIIALIDIMIINVFKPLHRTDHMIKIVRIFRVIRLIRLLRVLKLVIPHLISLLEKQINKQLTFRYDIAKGYVQGEEDTKYLIEQIAGHETISKEINKIMEKNKQDAMKELGLMQRDYPDIVTAVKTKQAVQTVLNTATETLKVLISGGIVDKNEGEKIQKMIFEKKKNIGTLPCTIAPPTAEELLHSISWLENEKTQIEFIQKKARLLCYDYGDVICEEHEMPQGIHLIISGMTKLCGSSPCYGIDKDIYEQRYPTTLIYTDYLVSGAIIGELNCLTKQEMEYTVTCETAVQTCFISMDDLFEAFDKFLECPSLEYKIWLKLALDITFKTFKENLAYQDWSYKMCTKFPNVYVMDVPTHSKCDIYDGTMDDVILVHGSVQDCQQLQPYFAPCILPKTCHQVQGTAAVTKLLIVRTATSVKRKSSRRCSNVCQYHSSMRRQATVGNTVKTDGSNQHSLRPDADTDVLTPGQSISVSVL
ncbi:solute carrier family 9 member C1 [Pelodiscus sinensis]|uniref:solute carrier family 9 member C1 n=1 Tax=Pelodiscus sinensis TaxID=13735 RepID=UPI000D71E235|nr:sodium/hydrogen exchanger 10 isoform X2 [Pelodiscus sinensis]|eukprot:XP_025044710.1 sodium/hydrogen exchanger 10 isoform X2 [Pelodiscus sinensis]